MSRTRESPYASKDQGAKSIGKIWKKRHLPKIVFFASLLVLTLGGGHLLGLSSHNLLNSSSHLEEERIFRKILPLKLHRQSYDPPLLAEHLFEGERLSKRDRKLLKKLVMVKLEGNEIQQDPFAMRCGLSREGRKLLKRYLENEWYELQEHEQFQNLILASEEVGLAEDEVVAVYERLTQLLNHVEVEDGVIALNHRFNESLLSKPFKNQDDHSDALAKVIEPFFIDGRSLALAETLSAFQNLLATLSPSMHSSFQEEDSSALEKESTLAVTESLAVANGSQQELSLLHKAFLAELEQSLLLPQLATNIEGISRLPSSFTELLQKRYLEAESATRLSIGKRLAYIHRHTQQTGEEDRSYSLHYAHNLDGSDGFEEGMKRAPRAVGSKDRLSAQTKGDTSSKQSRITFDPSYANTFKHLESFHSDFNTGLQQNLVDTFSILQESEMNGEGGENFPLGQPALPEADRLPEIAYGGEGWSAHSIDEDLAWDRITISGGRYNLPKEPKGLKLVEVEAEGILGVLLNEEAMPSQIAPMDLKLIEDSKLEVIAEGGHLNRLEHGVDSEGEVEIFGGGALLLDNSLKAERLLLKEGSLYLNQYGITQSDLEIATDSQLYVTEESRIGGSVQNAGAFYLPSQAIKPLQELENLTASVQSKARSFAPMALPFAEEESSNSAFKSVVIDGDYRGEKDSAIHLGVELKGNMVTADHLLIKGAVDLASTGSVLHIENVKALMKADNERDLLHKMGGIELIRAEQGGMNNPSNRDNNGKMHHYFQLPKGVYYTYGPYLYGFDEALAHEGIWHFAAVTTGSQAAAEKGRDGLSHLALPRAVHPYTGAYLGNLIAAHELFTHKVIDRHYFSAEEAIWGSISASFGQHFDTFKQSKTRFNYQTIRLGGDIVRGHWGEAFTRLGVMLAYGASENKSKNPSLSGGYHRAKGRGTAYTLGAYLTLGEVRRHYLDLSLQYLQHDSRVDRYDQASQSRYHAKGWLVRLEGGYRFDLGNAFSLQPILGATWRDLKQKPLKLQDGTHIRADRGYFEWSIGLRLHPFLKEEAGASNFIPYGELHYRQRSKPIAMKFNETVIAQEGAQKAWEAKVGFKAVLGSNLQVSGSLRHQWGRSNYRDTKASLGITFNL